MPMTYDLTTREGKTLSLTFDYPNLTTIIERTSLVEANKYHEANILLFKSCLPESDRSMIDRADVYMALINSDLLKKLLDTGFAVFREPSTATSSTTK